MEGCDIVDKLAQAFSTRLKRQMFESSLANA
jgi:hypothetical protein